MLVIVFRDDGVGVVTHIASSNKTTIIPISSDELIAPTSSEELEAQLPGTSWGLSEVDPFDGLIFFDDGTFGLHGEKNRGKYVVSARRSITLVWDDRTSVTCVFADNYGSFRETSHRKQSWRFLGRVKP